MVANERKLALSFDDVPTGDSLLMTGDERAERLIDGLERFSDGSAIFFVITRAVETEMGGKSRLASYSSAGHVLGNHGHSHLALSATSISDYIADLDLGRETLRAFEGVAPFFRHPFLDEGGSRLVHGEIDRALDERGLRRGHVTIKTYDFYLQALVDAATFAGREIDLNRIKDLYIELILGCAEFYDSIACRLIGRSPRHVLLLHENDLSALFIGDLIEALRGHSWRQISALEAYNDPFFQIDPDSVFRNQGLIAALANSCGWKRRDLVPVEEEEKYISTRFTSACGR